MENFFNGIAKNPNSQNRIGSDQDGSKKNQDSQKTKNFKNEKTKTEKIQKNVSINKKILYRRRKDRRIEKKIDGKFFLVRQAQTIMQSHDITV